MAAAAGAAEDATSLDDRIQSLPQELQDLILDFAVTPFTPGAVVCITSDYTPPVLLRINRATRVKAAAVYYSSQIFHCSLETTPEVRSWLASLETSHRLQLRQVRTRPYDICCCDSGCVAANFEEFESGLDSCGVQMSADVLRMKIDDDEELEDEKEPLSLSRAEVMALNA